MNFILNASQQIKLAWDTVKTQNEALRDAAISQVRVQAEMEKREVINYIFFNILGIKSTKK